MSVFFLNTDTTITAETESKNEGQTSDDHSQTQTEAQTQLNQFWAKAMDEIKAIRHMDLKQQVLPLARIKKIMKLDEDVKMISAEAPLLFAKAAEIFIHELTLRSWIHTEDNKRRTLQRNDIAMAITKFDQFDFLIDIVPREDIKPNKPKEECGTRTVINPEYYFQLAQQHHNSLQQTTTPQTPANTSHNAIQIVQSAQQVQTVQVNPLEQQTTASSSTATPPTQQSPVIIQQPATTTAPQAGGIQILQQIVTPTGEVQQIPIQLNQQQMQMIRMQLQSNTSQPLIIQAAPIQTAAQSQLIQVQQGNAAQPVFLAQANGTTESE